MRGRGERRAEDDDVPVADGRRRELRGGPEQLLLEQREEQRDAESGDERVEGRTSDQGAHHHPLDEPAEQRADDDRDEQGHERSRMPAEPGDPAGGPPQADEEAEGADLALRDGERPGALEDEHDADSDERVRRSRPTGR